jgi:hypothetical protein
LSPILILLVYFVNSCSYVRSHYTKLQLIHIIVFDRKGKISDA